MAAVRGLLAFWAGGASQGVSTTQAGVRSLLAPWMGGASSGVAPTTPAGVRSLLAFWAGGASAGVAPTTTARPWKRADYEALKRPQRDPVRADARLVDGDDVLTAKVSTLPIEVAAAVVLARIAVSADLQDEPDTLTAQATTAWPAVAMLTSPTMVRTPKMIRTPRLIRS